MPVRGVETERTDAKDTLAEYVRPGARLLSLAGVATSVATASTASTYLAIAAIAQLVLLPGTGNFGQWFALLAGSGALRAMATAAADQLAVEGAIRVERALQTCLLERSVTSRAHPIAVESAGVLLDEVTRIGRYAERSVPTRVAGVVVPLVILGIVVPQSWLVGLLLLFCAPLAPLNLSIIGMGAADAARRNGVELQHLSAYFFDRLRGLSTIRLLGAGARELAIARQTSAALAATSMQVLRVAFLAAGALEAIVTITVAVVAMYVGLTLLGYVHIPGLPSTMSLQTGLFLLMVTPLFFAPVRAAAASYHERAEAFAAASVVRASLNTEELAEEWRPARVPITSPPPIAVRHVTVHYPGRADPALDDVSLEVHPGELLGVAGPSGAGKSTLLRAVAGSVPPSAGAVLVGDVASSSLPATAITWLGHRPHLFPGSIAANIGLDDPSDLPRIQAAAEAAGLTAVIRGLPEGILTRVDEGGVGLSRGESHRIALARCFIKQSSVLLLDEPTAHLDAATETDIVAAIVRIARGATTVVVSHSPAVLAACDRVVVLDRGILTPIDRAGKRARP